MLLTLALACTSAPGTGDSAPAPDITLTAAPAFDPLAGPALTWTLSGEDAKADAPGEIRGEDGEVVRSKVLPALGWDGKDDDGKYVGTGTYTLAVGAEERERTAPVALVRAGVLAAYAEDDDGVTATRVPLYWHQKRHTQDLDDPFVTVEAIDDASGVVVLPAVGEGLNVPATDAAEPVAYPFDSRPIVSLTLGATSTLGAAHLGDVPLHLSIPGWTVLGDTPLADGAVVTLQKDEPLGTTLGVSEEPLVATVSATDDAVTAWPVATIEVPWRAYRLLGPPTFEQTDDERYNPWVAAVDPALRALEGTTPTHDATLDALVRWVFEDGGLSYDTVSGASAYTVYVQGDWARANFQMTSFLSRKFGLTVNCTDCAGIMVSYGNMLGAEVDYAIIGWNFNLDYILAIGGTEFDHCPFGDYGCGFSYHAVTTDIDNALIWDATLALDGDEDPTSLPSTERLVQSVPSDEYLERLVLPPTTASYVYQAQGTLQ